MVSVGGGCRRCRLCRCWHVRMRIGLKLACSHSLKLSLPLLIRIGYGDVDRLFTCG